MRAAGSLPATGPPSQPARRPPPAQPGSRAADVQHRALEGAVRLTDRTLTELATSAAAEADDFLSSGPGSSRLVLDGHRLGQHIVRGGLHGSAITGGLDLDDQARVEVKIAVHLQPAALHHALEARLAAGRTCSSSPPRSTRIQPQVT